MNKQVINSINPKNIVSGALTLMLGSGEGDERAPLFHSVEVDGKTVVYVNGVHNYRIGDDKMAVKPDADRRDSKSYRLSVVNGAAQAIVAAYESGKNAVTAAFVGETSFRPNENEGQTYVNATIHARVASVIPSWAPTIEPTTRMVVRLASEATKREDSRGMPYASVTGYREDYQGGADDPDKRVFIQARGEGNINSLMALAKPGVNLAVKGEHVGRVGNVYAKGKPTGETMVEETLFAHEIGDRRNNLYYGVARMTDNPEKIETALTDDDGKPLDQAEVRLMIAEGQYQPVGGGKVDRRGVVARYVATGSAARGLLERGKRGDDVIIIDARYSARAFQTDDGELRSYAEIRGGRIALPQSAGNYAFGVVRTHGHVSREVEVGETGAGDAAATINMVANYYNPSANGRNSESVEIATYREEAERHAAHLGVGSEIVAVGAPDGVSAPFMLKSGDNEGDVVANAKISNSRIAYLSASVSKASDDEDAAAESDEG